jgi:hypothetical protein
MKFYNYNDECIKVIEDLENGKIYIINTSNNTIDFVADESDEILRYLYNNSIYDSIVISNNYRQPIKYYVKELADENDSDDSLKEFYKTIYRKCCKFI